MTREKEKMKENIWGMKKTDKRGGKSGGNGEENWGKMPMRKKYRKDEGEEKNRGKQRK